jgi:hypothetical protein
MTEAMSSGSESSSMSTVLRFTASFALDTRC